jgi:hypothetical protein
MAAAVIGIGKPRGTRGTIGPTSIPPPGSPVSRASQNFIRQSLQLPQANNDPDARHTPLTIGIFGLSLLYEIASVKLPDEALADERARLAFLEVTKVLVFSST